MKLVYTFLILGTLAFSCTPKEESKVNQNDQLNTKTTPMENTNKEALKAVAQKF